MKHLFGILGIVLIAGLWGFSPISEKLVSQKTHIKFFSTTPAEDIEAHNYKSVSTLSTESGKVVFSVPMQAFEFEKSLMQKHFNQKTFLHTKKHPKAKLIGEITNLSSVNFDKDGTYNAEVEGELTIRGVTKPISTEGTVTVEGDNVQVKSQFDITLADFGITFEKGKPSKNIAETVEVTAIAEY